jgi:hypothetical protein
MQQIQTFSDGSTLTFDEGSFDNWCVYLQMPNQAKYAPTDLQYFTRLQQLGEIYGHQKIYDDFISFYTQTNHQIDQQILNLIRNISSAYIDNQLEIEKLFTIVYAGMIAEENKEHAVLKKRIKRLGMNQLLLEKLPPEYAVNYSRGKKWHELDQICRAKGF